MPSIKRGADPLPGASGTSSGRRAQLLEVAAELFAERGYAATTVRDIADKAGILSGSLYHHFNSKEEMLGEIVRVFLTQLHVRFKEIEQDGGSPDKVLDALVEHSFATIHGSLHSVALYQNEAGFLRRLEGFEFVSELSIEIERIWLRTIREGQKAGVFRKDLDAKVTYLYLRDTVWASARWYRPGGKLSANKIAAQYLLLLHGGILAQASEA